MTAADPHGLKGADGQYTQRTKVAAWFYASQINDPHHRITDEERERFLALADDLLDGAR